MQKLPQIGIVFVAIAVIFMGVVLRDYLMAEAKMTLGRKIWLQIAFIFVGVMVGLYFFQVFLF